MSCSTTVLRSNKAYIEFTPCGNASDNTLALLDFTQTGASAISGTFRLVVNGKITAPITYSSTVATLATSVDTALDNALGASTLSAAADATETTKVAITAPSSGYWDIRVVTSNDAGVATLLNGIVAVRYRLRGTQTYVITPELMSFTLNRDTSLEDVSPLSDKATTQVVVGEESTFDTTLYYTSGTIWPAIIRPDTEGTLGVWMQGKVVGSPYFIAKVLFTSANVPLEMKSIVTIEFSGSVQGDFIVPVGTSYNP